MKTRLFRVYVVFFIFFTVLNHGSSVNRSESDNSRKNKFRERKATDDSLGYPNIDEDALLITECPQKLELRWQTEVSSSIYSSPLIADINSDGKSEVVLPSFVHYLEILEGSDGDKLPGWPAFHKSTVHSSPLLYDIDKDGIREIALATYNGEVLFFRISGHIMPEKLIVPRRKVKKKWYVGLHPDPADRSHPDVHDDLLIEDTERKSSTNSSGKGVASVLKEQADFENLLNTTIAKNKNDSHIGNTTNIIKNIDNATFVNISLRNESSENGANTGRRLLESNITKGALEHGSESEVKHDDTNVSTVENDEGLGADADSSFDLFRDSDEFSEDYNYDYDDYFNETMWGEEEWFEQLHENVEDYVHIDSHILSTPVIADIDGDGITEMVIAVSYFFDREYYDNQEHLKYLGDIDVGKYVAGSIVVFDLNSKQVKWITPLDISTDSSQFRAYIYSSPTVVDLDGDGCLDIVVGTSYGLFYVLDHNGKVREKFPLEMAEIHGAIAAADINDDGKIEMVTTDAHGNVAAWSANGQELWETHLKSSIPQGPSVGDVDGDGHTDIVVTTSSGKIYVLNGTDGSIIHPYPFTTHGQLMSKALLVDLSRNGDMNKGLTIITTSFDGYLYLIYGPTSCADVVDIGEMSYSMVLADNIDGGDDLDLLVTTMNGNVLCFSTSTAYHPLKAWRAVTQGRNNVATRYGREGVYVLPSSRLFRDEGGSKFWVEFDVVDRYRFPSGAQGPYNVTVSLLVPENYQNERKIVRKQVSYRAGRHRIELPVVTTRVVGTVVVEMTDRNGIYFSDEFVLTFHMHFYRIFKWIIGVPMLGMLGMLVVLRPREPRPLPSFSRSYD